MRGQTQGVVDAIPGRHRRQQFPVAQAFHDLDSEAALDHGGQGDLLKAQVARVGRVQRDQRRVPVVGALEQFDHGVGIAVDREADKAALAGLLGGDQRLHRAARGKDGFHIVLGVPDLVELPEIDVVGFHALEPGIQLPLGAFSGALVALGRYKNVLAEQGQDGAVDLFRASAPVIVGVVVVVDPEIVAAAHDRRGLLPGNHPETRPAGPDHGEHLPGLTELAFGDVTGFYIPVRYDSAFHN